MADLIKRLVYNEIVLGDIVRCTHEVHGTRGKRFKFLGAIYKSEGDPAPEYLDLVDIKTGKGRAVRPEFVVKEEASSRASQARRARKAAKKA